jgi:hypothetical protein
LIFSCIVPLAETDALLASVYPLTVLADAALASDEIFVMA